MKPDVTPPTYPVATVSQPIATQPNLSPQQPPAFNQVTTPPMKKSRKKLYFGLALGIFLVAGGIVGGLSVLHKPTVRQSAPLKTSASSAPTALQAPVSSVSSLPLATTVIDPKKVPLGKDKYTSSAKVGYVYSCATSYSSTAGGAQVAGP